MNSIHSEKAATDKPGELTRSEWAAPVLGPPASRTVRNPCLCWVCVLSQHVGRGCPPFTRTRWLSASSVQCRAGHRGGSLGGDCAWKGAWEAGGQVMAEPTRLPGVSAEDGGWARCPQAPCCV